MIRPTNNWR